MSLLDYDQKIKERTKDLMSARSEASDMTNPIASTDFETVRGALTEGSITLKDVAERFVDLKTLYDQNSNLEVNNRYKPTANFDRDHLDNTYLFAAGKGKESPLSLWLDYCCCQTVDCDGCKSTPVVTKAANELYQALWPDAQKRGADSADTMNSFWTTYKRALILDGQSMSSRGDIPAIHDNQESYRLSDDAVRSQIELFAHLTHTCGNFIPVGGKFQQRGGHITMDYWDVTMQYVKEWYEGSKDVEFLVGCDEWLSSFGEGARGWNTFVEKNFLQPYVFGRGDTKHKPYDVRHLFRGHYFDPNKNYYCDHLLPWKKELLACLLSMNAAIIARGNLMLHAIIGKDASACDTLLPLVTPKKLSELQREIAQRDESRQVESEGSR